MKPHILYYSNGLAICQCFPDIAHNKVINCEDVFKILVNKTYFQNAFNEQRFIN